MILILISGGALVAEGPVVRLVVPRTGADVELVASVPAAHVSQLLGDRPRRPPMPSDARLPAPGRAFTCRLTAATGNARVTGQLSVCPAADGALDPDGRWLVAKIPRAADVERRRFTVDTDAAQPALEQAAWHFEPRGDAAIELFDGDHPVLAYNFGIVTNDRVPASDPRRGRSCYIHPIWTVAGQVLTDDFPADHFHHHGLFWAWPHVEMGGQEYDMWLGRGIEQRFTKWLACETGPAAAVLAAESGWYVAQTRVVTERTWLCVHQALGGHRAVDIECYWIPEGQPVTLRGAEGKGYGGVTLRFAPRDGTVITTAAGVNPDDLLETRLTWADLSGRFGEAGHAAGAALFAPPSHPDYPPMWLTRHYGALFVGWPGIESRSFPAGQPFGVRYRLWIHDGVGEVGQLEAAYEDFTAVEGLAWEHE